MTKEKIIIPADPHFKSVFAIVNTPGKTFVCPGWHEVPIGTTRDQIEMDMNAIPIKKKVVLEEPKTTRYEIIVQGSKPGREYTVKLDRGMWSCTCPAATFQRGHCKHVKAEQNKLEKV
jgi:hypothetical protein